MKLSIYKIQNFMIISLLFLAAMNLMAKFYYFVFAAFLVLLLFRRRIVVDASVLVYLGLGAIMAVYNAPEGILSMLRCMAWFMFYLVGLNAAAARSTDRAERLEYDRSSAEKSCNTMIMAIAAGSFGHYLMNFLYNRQNLLERNTNDIWSGDIMAATGQAALSCIMCGLVVAFLFAPPRKGCRLIGALCMAGLLAYNLVLACRTPLVILGVLMIIGVVYLLKNTQTRRQKLRMLTSMILTVGALGVVLVMDPFHIWDDVMGSNLFERLDGFGDSLGESARFASKMAFLQNGHLYPLGGSHLMKAYGYAHDIWLDGYDEYGILGLIPLVIITVEGILGIIRLVRRTSYSDGFKLMLVCVYAAIMMEFCVEPILQGMSWLFACYCLLNGCIAGLNMAHQKTRGAIYEDPSDQYRIR